MLIQRWQDGFFNLRIQEDVEPVKVVLQFTKSQRATTYQAKKLNGQLRPPMKQRDQFCVDLAKFVRPFLETLNHLRGNDLLDTGQKFLNAS